MKISATWSSSRIATRVSWALEEMIISLVMPVAPAGCETRPTTELRHRHQQVPTAQEPEDAVIIVCVSPSNS